MANGRSRKGWRAHMGPASFRGVPFFVETAELSGGRRGVTHEYPGWDVPFREDLGRQARGFPVEGYVLGDDYLTKRDALLTALEAQGPGELVHPYHGQRRVAAVSFRVRESIDEGGVAKFSIEFVETPAEPSQPTAVVDAPAMVRSGLARVRTGVQAEFTAGYDPGVYMDAVEGVLRGATAAVENLLADVQLGTQELADLRRRVDRLNADVVALVNVPADLLAELVELFGLCPPGVLDVYYFDAGPAPAAETANQAQERANYDALERLIRRLALLRAVELTLDETFDSYEAAIEARDALLGPIDEQAELVSDDVYPRLVQLRADLVKAVPGEGSDLPHLVTYTPPATLPSLVLAHQLYGDVTLEGDLVTRNGVAHPGFVPGGEGLEVLSRA